LGIAIVFGVKVHSSFVGHGAILELPDRGGSWVSVFREPLQDYLKLIALLHLNEPGVGYLSVPRLKTQTIGFRFYP
jgi:hypothetical protein